MCITEERFEELSQPNCNEEGKGINADELHHLEECEECDERYWLIVWSLCALTATEIWWLSWIKSSNFR